MSFKNRYGNLGHPRCIWAVSVIEGRAEKLSALHASIAQKFKPGDRLLYTGNYFCGPYARPAETFGEILSFRNMLTTRHRLQDADIVYLRGIQEELFTKLLQLQFAPDAGAIIDWIASKHPEMDRLLRIYDSSLDEAAKVAREGTLCLTRWSTFLKGRIRQLNGHENFFTDLKRAAFTDGRFSNDNNLLFVHAGLNPHLPLESQGDSFWWASKKFNEMPERYRPFRTVIRGYDPEGNGIHIGRTTISLDGGNKLVCAEISNMGDVIAVLAA